MELGKALLEGAKKAKLSEEELEAVWVQALEPEPGRAFRAQMDAERAKVRAQSIARVEACRCSSDPLSVFFAGPGAGSAATSS